MRITIALASLLLASTASSLAFAASPMDECRSMDAVRAIGGCTMVIEDSSADRAQRSLAYSLRGRAYASHRRYDTATADFKKAIQLNPKNADAYGLRGHMMLIRDMNDEALSDLSKALKLSPNFTGALINRSIANMKNGNMAAAMRDIDKAVNLEPTNALALANRGRLHRMQGQIDKAIVDLSQALALAPRLTFALSERIDAYMLKNELERALADCDTLLQLAPRYPNAEQRRKAIIALRGGRPAESRPAPVAQPNRVAPQQAPVAQPSQPSAPQAAGPTASREELDAMVKQWQGQLAQNDLDGAFKTALRLIQAAPNAPISYLLRGVVYTKRGDLGRGLADYDRSLSLNPRFAPAHGEKGLLLVAAKRFDQAIASCTTALELAPTMFIAHYCRGLGYLGSNRVEEALADFSKTVEMSHTFHMGWSYRGLTLAKLGQHDDAIESFTKALSLNQSADNYALRGQSYAARGDAAMAERDYQQALAIDKNNRTAQMGLEALKASRSLGGMGGRPKSG
jgi:tetratricopeptide (TPR) repeat protein